ncbi:MAG: hypothetical protein NW201_03320 [Gemmatimonadales bacterium]|nr:hypothetical protein [Gemmatimonadales bacterium]
MRPALPLLALLAACTRVTDAERLGDRAYVAGRYADAATAYQAAVGTGAGAPLQARYAQAAWHAGRLRDAARAWAAVAADDPTRAVEAADGLELVARDAARQQDVPALREAVFGLLAAAPDRPLGVHALALATAGPLGAADGVAVLPAALAAAPDPSTVDVLLATWGEALRETGACEPAIDAFRAVIRRSGQPDLRARADLGTAHCAVRLGANALDAGAADIARRWLELAVATDSAGEAGRAAALLLARLPTDEPVADSTAGPDEETP